MRETPNTRKVAAARVIAADALCLDNTIQTGGLSHHDSLALLPPTGAVRWNRRSAAGSALPLDAAKHVATYKPMFALTPVVVYSVLAFGMSALLLVLTATLACVLTEHLICRITGKTTTIFITAGYTGVLFGPHFSIAEAGIAG